MAIMEISGIYSLRLQGGAEHSSYYCDVVLNQGLLPDIQKLSGNNFTFEQDAATVHDKVLRFVSSFARICGSRKLAAK